MEGPSKVLIYMLCAGRWLKGVDGDVEEDEEEEGEYAVGEVLYGSFGGLVL